MRRRPMRAAIVAAAFACVVASMLLAGCGQKGPLKLPPAEPAPKAITANGAAP